MAYLYTANIDTFDRSEQLEIMLDNGDSAILRRGHYYDLTAGELQRARQYVTMVFVATPPDEEPIGVEWLPLKGNPTDGQIPVFAVNEGAFVPAGVSGVGGASAIPFTPTGTVAATNTQAAVAEVSGDVVAVEINKADKAKLPLNASDFQGAGVSDETALLAACAAAAAQTRSLFIPRRTSSSEWVITVPLDTITAGGIEVYGDGTTIRQSTAHKPVFDLLTTNDVDVHDLFLRSTATRVQGGSSFRGDDITRYAAGVWGAGSRCKARNLRVEGLDSGAYFGNWTTGSTHAGTPQDNVIDNVTGSDLWVGALAVAQRGLRLGDVNFSSIARPSGGTDPAHGVYVSAYNADHNYDLHGGVWRVTACADSAVVMRYTHGATVDAIIGSACRGSLYYHALVDTNIGAVVSTGDTMADENGSLSAAAVDVLSERFEIGTVILGMANAARAISWWGSDSVIRNCTVVANRPATSGAEDIIIRGVRSGIQNLRHRNAGSLTTGAEAVRIGLSAGDAVDCFLSRPEIRNTPTAPSCRNAIVVDGDAVGTVLDYDPAMLVPEATFSKVSNSGTGTKRSLVNKRASCRVHKAAAQTLTTAVAAALVLDAETDDVDAMHDTVTNNTRITLPYGGRYRVNAIVSFVANATGIRRLQVRRNGSAIHASVTQNAVATGTTDMSFCCDVGPMLATDYIEVLAYQDSGGNLDTVAAHSVSVSLISETT